MWAHLADLSRASLVTLHRVLYAQQLMTLDHNERDEYTDKLAMLECLIERSD